MVVQPIILTVLYRKWQNTVTNKRVHNLHILQWLHDTLHQRIYPWHAPSHTLAFNFIKIIEQKKSKRAGNAKPTKPWCEFTVNKVLNML